MHILDKIVAHKKEEVLSAKSQRSAQKLEESDFFGRTCNSLAQSLRSSQHGIISEFKRRSPSKPDIFLEAAVADIVPFYADAGVGGISILSDSRFFGGSHDDILTARKLVETPILRKEFIIDEYQIVESKSIGADAILLIAEILTKEEVKTFTNLAKSLSLDIIFEIHTRLQLDKYCDGIDIIGVNNRDLTRFTVDPQQSVDLFEYLPIEVVKISESGLHNIETITMLQDVGYQGFLIGERFMKTKNPGNACAEFISQLS